MSDDDECDNRVTRSDTAQLRCFLRPGHVGQHLYAPVGFDVRKGWQFNRAPLGASTRDSEVKP